MENADFGALQQPRDTALSAYRGIAQDLGREKGNLENSSHICSTRMVYGR